MQHFFQKGTNPEAPVLLILHGTGGSERDLLPVAQMIDKTASVLGVKGNVLENGMPRFFKRLREGVFDEEDLVKQTAELRSFINGAAHQYDFDGNNVMAIGYSNGANIAASLLFHYEDVLQNAILFHPMVPIRNIELPDLNKQNVFIGAGTNDPICMPEETNELVRLLEGAKAQVAIHWENLGHQLTENEVLEAKKWYDNSTK